MISLFAAHILLSAFNSENVGKSNVQTLIPIEKLSEQTSWTIISCRMAAANGLYYKEYIRFNGKNFYKMRDFDSSSPYNWGPDLCKDASDCIITTDNVKVFGSIDIQVPQNCNHEVADDILHARRGRRCEETVYATTVELNRVNGKVKIDNEIYHPISAKKDVFNIDYGECVSAGDPLLSRRF